MLASLGRRQQWPYGLTGSQVFNRQRRARVVNGPRERYAHERVDHRQPARAMPGVVQNMWPSRRPCLITRHHSCHAAEVQSLLRKSSCPLMAARTITTVHFPSLGSRFASVAGRVRLD